MLFWIPLVQFTGCLLIVIVILPCWSYHRGKSSTPPQITIRKLLWFTLLYAGLIAALQTIERRHAQASREIEAWRVNARLGGE